jgi:ZIP family zinc transporter
MAANLNLTVWLVLFIGFFGGSIFLFLGDKVYDLYLKKHNKNTSLKRSALLVSSITIHNIPEGLAIGVSFGSVVYGFNGATLIAAWILALGIGLQNFPEGSAVSLPLYRDGFSKNKAFFVGGASGIVEPIASIIGAMLVIKIQILLPYLLAFAAGAMIYVVTCEIIPESQTNNRKDLMTLFTLMGFSIMMVLDIALS